MRTAARSAIVLFLSLMLSSCAQPVHRVSLDESFMKPDAGRKAWRKVAVLPFAGEPAFRRTAAEWLAFQVRRYGLFEIVDPSLAEIELGKKGVSVGESVAVDEAKKAGELLGVDGVVIGAVDPLGGRRHASAGGVRASVVDVATGKVVGERVRPAFVVFRFDQGMVAADVSQAAQDLAPVLYAAAGKIWTSPTKAEAREQDSPARDPALR